MNARDKVRLGESIVVTLTRARSEEGCVTALFDDRFELELSAVENAYEHFSNVSAPAVHRTITIYFEDLLEVEPGGA